MNILENQEPTFTEGKLTTKNEGCSALGTARIFCYIASVIEN